ncbi:MAG TPA: hypothetical protein VM510_08700 [Caulifigura sp.]|jgi:hypothetical protein|nr:hypothetical protein [Caulifigura sp.]
MPFSPTLLVYDDAVETSEVLAAVYQPRGFTVERRTDFADSEQAGTGTNTVVLMHAGDRPMPLEQPLRVVIGRANTAPRSDRPCEVAACRISSLFDYRELVSAIDRLLCGSD